MAIITISDIAKMGMISDVDSGDLPPSAFSFLGNVRNTDGHLSRGPVFLQYGNVTNDPRHIYATTDTNSINHLLVVTANGSIKELSSQNNPASDVSISGYAPTADSDAIVTFGETQNILYANREDREIWYRVKTSSGPFAKLSSYNSGAKDSNGYALAQFDPTWRAKVLRTFDSFVLLFNVRKGGQSFPQMIKWSDVSDYGNPPRDWDVANGASSAGENTLAEMKTEILDACRVGNDMIVFSRDECYQMQYTGDSNVFNFRRIDGKGVINTNCAVEHGARLYVFGDNDIYVTDGNSCQSIADGAVRKFVFQSLVETEKDKCFVAHDIANSTVHFCFVSAGANIAFPYLTGVPASCNRAASFNYVSNTWTMTDLPFARCGYPITYTTGLTINDLSNTPFDGITGTFQSMATSISNVMMFGSKTYTSPTTGATVSAALRLHSLYGTVTAPIDSEATSPCLMIKSKITFDDRTLQGSGLKLRNTKQLSAIYPGVEFDPSAGPLTFTIGKMAGSNDIPTWTTPVTCDGTAKTGKLSINVAAKYFAIKITYADAPDFRLSAFDLDLKNLGGI